MKTLVIGALALGLCGCTSLAAVNPDGGVVENAGSAAGAMKLAQAHCEKTGRNAKTTNYDAFMGSMVFECVAK